MRATGIVRRVDDLGRVVIPKEVRQHLHIREGDPLELFAGEDGEVIFKPYMPFVEPWIVLDDLAETIDNEDFRPFVGELRKLSRQMKNQGRK